MTAGRFRYAAEYLKADLNPPDCADEDYSVDLYEYGTVTGTNLQTVVAEARSKDLFGDEECYGVRLEVSVYLDGLFLTWETVEEYDPYDLPRDPEVLAA